MKSAKVPALKKQLARHLITLGKLRDKLDKTKEEIESILDDAQEQRDVADRAISSLEECRDALSEIT